MSEGFYGLGIGAIIVFVIMTSIGEPPGYIEGRLCPALLAHAETPADSTAVVEEFNECWTYVHPEAP